MNEEAVISHWVAGHLGAHVQGITRQARWRAAWLVDAERDGMPLPLMVRGERGADIPMQFPLRHEMTLQKTMGEHGISVPTVSANSSTAAKSATRAPLARPDQPWPLTTPANRFRSSATQPRRDSQMEGGGCPQPHARQRLARPASSLSLVTCINPIEARERMTGFEPV